MVLLPLNHSDIVLGDLQTKYSWEYFDTSDHRLLTLSCVDRLIDCSALSPGEKPHCDMESVGVDRRYFLTDAIPVSGTSRRGTLAYLFIAIN